MEIETIKAIVLVSSLIVLLLIGPVVRWFMRDRYKVYKDVFGNDVKIKTHGYVSTIGGKEKCVK